MTGDIEPSHNTGDVERPVVDIVLSGGQEVDLATATAAFLMAYRGTTRKNHASSLRAWFRWCAEFGLRPLVDPTRHHIEAYCLWLDEERHMRPSSIAQRLGTVVIFYRYLYDSGLCDHNPADGVRRPRVPLDSRVPRLDAEGLGRLLKVAEPNPAEHLLICLLGLMGLRASEAVGAQITALEVIGDRRVITIQRKGGKYQTLPLPPFVAAAVDRAVGRRTEGPLLVWGYWREPMSRVVAYRVVKRLAAAAGLDSRVHPHALRHAFITIVFSRGRPATPCPLVTPGRDVSVTTSTYRAGRVRPPAA